MFSIVTRFFNVMGLDRIQHFPSNQSPCMFPVTHLVSKGIGLSRLLPPRNFRILVLVSWEGSRCHWLGYLPDTIGNKSMCVPATSVSATPQTAALQAPFWLGFSGQKQWSGLPFPPQGDLSHPGTEPMFQMAGCIYRTRRSHSSMSCVSRPQSHSYSPNKPRNSTRAWVLTLKKEEEGHFVLEDKSPLKLQIWEKVCVCVYIYIYIIFLIV